MSGALRVKASLQREGRESGRDVEIRRFRVEEDGGDRFQCLLKTVHTIFKIDSSNNHCTVSWKDEDGDLVQFSTSQELQYAVENMPDDTLRIYVTVRPNAAEATTAPSAETANDGSWQAAFEGFEQAFQPPPPPVYTHFDRPTGGMENPGGSFTPHGWHWDPRGMGPGMRGMRHGFRGMGGGWRGMGPRGMHCDWRHFGHHMHGHMKKFKKFMKGKHWMRGDRDEEFCRVRQQVPESFRCWVRQFARTWYSHGAEAAAKIGNIPSGLDQSFPQWLLEFLVNYYQRQQAHTMEGHWGVEGDGQGDMLPAPEGLPPVYYQWLCMFVPRFFRRVSSSDEEGPQFGKAFWKFHGRKFCHGKRKCHKKKGFKRGWWSSSSESEESDHEQKMWQKVPKGFRKYVRSTMKQLHKKKRDNPKIKEKALQAGVSKDIQEFVEQVLLMWHAKLSTKRPRDVAKEMMEGETTLPAGLERPHFEWMCRFMVRWHQRHAGKCDVMSAWSSGETSDDTSGDEAAAVGHHHHHHHDGFHQGHHPPMHPGMGHPFPPPLPPYPMFGCAPPPHHSSKPSSAPGEANRGHDDMMDQVTEGVKKM